MKTELSEFEKIQVAVSEHEHLLGELDSVSADSKPARKLITQLRQVEAELVKTEYELDHLRPGGDDFRNEADRLANARQALLVSLQAMLSGVAEAVDRCRLAAYEQRHDLLEPYEEAVKLAETEALANMSGFVDAMQEVKESRETLAARHNIFHRMADGRLVPQGGMGKASPDPAWLGQGRFSSTTLNGWLSLYLGHFQDVMGNGGLNPETVTLEWFNQRVRK
jgi:hypothetical protein